MEAATMFLIDRLILLAAILLLAGIVSSKFSSRLGLPVLVLFLAIGMLAGEDGPGGLEFDDVGIAHAVGTLALAIILFDGGLQTRAAALRAVWVPALLLATVGVVVTALVTGLVAAAVLNVPLLTGLLLGSIVASTDAAAVFSVLRSQGLNLRRRVASTLEVESGSNDPMAIFLTIGLLGVLDGRIDSAASLVLLFVRQMGIGGLSGLACGWLAVRIINRIQLGAPGLYPVLAGAAGLAAFGVAANTGGSGFLAIYVAGIVLGNSRTVFQRGTFLFMDGLAWIGQITMFVVLGLLSTPSELVGVALPALIVAGVQILIARPLAVAPLLVPFGFSVREQALVAFVGLRGAVPIILAMFPLIFGHPEGRLLFNVVFFVVLVSATLQGWTLPPLATWLGVREPGRAAPSASLELLALRDVKADVVDYVINPDSLVAGRTVGSIGLPEGAVVAVVLRDGALIAPKGATLLQPGDHVFVVSQTARRAEVDRVFEAQAGG